MIKNCTGSAYSKLQTFGERSEPVRPGARLVRWLATASAIAGALAATPSFAAGQVAASSTTTAGAAQGPQSTGATPPDSTAAAASPQEGLGDIVVTARQRSENLQSTPFSIAAVSQAKLQDLNIRTTMGLDNQVPGLVIRPDNNRVQPFVGIRGVGDISRNPGIDNRTGLYLDGIPLGRSSSVNYPIFDIENVEVLRGPQGTLFGNNSLTGVISIQSKKPSPDDSGRVTAGYGSRNLFYGSGYINKKLSDDLFVRITLAGQSQDGYYENLYDGSKPGGGRNFAGRLQVRYEPSSNTTVDFSADAVSARDDILLGVGKFSTGPNVGLPDYRVNLNVSPKRDRNIYGTSLTVRQALPYDFTLDSISSYRSSKDSFQYDGDGSPLSILNVGFRYKDWDVSQELRIVSPRNKYYDFVVGAFYYHQNPSEIEAIRYGSDAPASSRGAALTGGGRVREDQYAVYAHGTIRPTDWLAIDGGARYQYTTKDGLKIQDPGVAALGYAVARLNLKLHNSTVDPMVSVTVTPTAGINIYALYSTGNRAGGFNIDVTPTLSGVTFGSETVKNYEAGIKAKLLNNRLRLNVAVYSERFSNFQQAQNIIDPNPAPGTIARVISVITNAAGVKSRGVEADFDALLAKGLTLTGGVGWNHAFYSSFPNGGGPGVDFTGNTLIEAPRFQSSAALSYQRALTNAFDGRFSVDYVHRTRVFSQPANAGAPVFDDRYVEGGYSLVGMRLAAINKSGGYEVALYARNLLNEKYVDNAAPVAAGYLLKALNEPRVVGAEVTLRF